MLAKPVLSHLKWFCYSGTAPSSKRSTIQKALLLETLCTLRRITTWNLFMAFYWTITANSISS